MTLLFRLSVLLILPLLSPVAPAAETAQDQLDFLATAIQKGDAPGALALFDPQMAGFAELKRNLEALSHLPSTYCSLTVVHTAQSGDVTRFEADWSLQTHSEQNGPPLDRRDRVEIGVRHSTDGWKIISMTPVAVLQPPDDSLFRRIAQLATDLNEKDGSGALGVFDSGLKQYGEIDNDIDALITQNDVLCAIDIVSDRQTGPTHTLDLDWYFQLKSRADAGPTEQRRERVKVDMRMTGGKWKIIKIDSLKILSPAITP